jgi:hypothetical protein
MPDGCPPEQSPLCADFNAFMYATSGACQKQVTPGTLLQLLLQLPLTARRSRHREQMLLRPGKPSVQHGFRHAAAAVAAPQQPGQRTNAITIVQDRLCACKDRNRGRHPGGGDAEGHAQPTGQAQLQRQQQQQQQQEQLEEQHQGQQQAQVRVQVQQT